jgi:hypothetical protein
MVYCCFNGNLVARDRRPKPGVGRREFLNWQPIMFLNQAVVLLLLLASVYSLPTSDHIYELH